MARKSVVEKEESRRRILNSAAELFRKQGIANTSVADVMDDAGMTHGGFYRHFQSKSDLVTEAISESFHAGLDVFDLDTTGTPEEVEAYIEQYLSEQHVYEPEIGCPLPTLSSEIARGDSAWQAALSSGFSTAAQKLTEGIKGADRSDALVILSTMVGSIVLARGMRDEAMTAEILRATNKHIADLRSGG